MSTVWDKLRSKVKVTVDEAGLELEKQSGDTSVTRKFRRTRNLVGKKKK